MLAEKAAKEKSTGRVQLHRKKMKDDGFKNINIFMTPEHKEILQTLCKSMRVPQATVVSYLLDCAVEQTLPKIDEPFGS